MTVADQARAILDLRGLPLPPRPKVLQIAVEDYVDASGDDALRVDVLIDDNATLEDIRSGGVRQLKRAISDRLRSEGIELFPYIFLAKPSELADLAEENEEDA